MLAAALLLAATAAVGHGASVRAGARAPQGSGSAADVQQDVLAAAGEDDLFDAVDDVADIEEGSGAPPAAPRKEEIARQGAHESRGSGSPGGSPRETMEEATEVVDQLVAKHGSAGPNWTGPGSDGSGSSAAGDAGSGSNGSDDARKDVFPSRGSNGSDGSASPGAGDVMFGSDRGSGSGDGSAGRIKRGLSATKAGTIDALAGVTGSTGSAGGGDDGSEEGGGNVLTQLAQRMQRGEMSSAALRRAARKASALGSAAVQRTRTASVPADDELSPSDDGFSFRALRSGASLRTAAHAAARTQAQARAEAEAKARILATAEDMVQRQAAQAHVAAQALPPECPKDESGQVCSGHGSCMVDDEEGGGEGEKGKDKAGLNALARFRSLEGEAVSSNWGGIGKVASAISSGISGAAGAIKSAASSVVSKFKPKSPEPPKPPPGKCVCENGFYGSDCSVDVNGGCSPLDPTCGEPQPPKPMPCVGRPGDFPPDSPCNEPSREWVPYPPQEPPSPPAADEKPNT